MSTTGPSREIDNGIGQLGASGGSAFRIPERGRFER
jgi:hypothetical protein